MTLPHRATPRDASPDTVRRNSARTLSFDGNPYTLMPPTPITSKSNARVKSLRASFSGNASLPGDVLGIEGEHLIAEAIRSGYTLETLFLREGSESILTRPSLSTLDPRITLLLSRDVFASAVETASPQGIAAIILLHAPAPPTPQPQSTILVLEGLQDPGNLGTLIRSAEAFGAQQIFVTPDTVNQWNPKVVRASAGSVFRIPILRAPLQQIAERLVQQGTTLYAAVAQSPNPTSLLDVHFAPHTALMIGNEGAGLSAAALALAHHCIRIPCAVESLNAAVAGSTLLYEALRQRAQHPTEATP
jgi:TrmH family RNA methyltransferase